MSRREDFCTFRRTRHQRSDPVATTHAVALHQQDAPHIFVLFCLAASSCSVLLQCNANRGTGAISPAIARSILIL
jgi:hypothetical protein